MITRRALLEAAAAAVALGRSTVQAASRQTSGTAQYPNLFSPIAFRTFTAKNRVFRSNVSGRFDNYDGGGTQTRINWELKFARGGVGAIISSFVPVAMRGRIMATTRRSIATNAFPSGKSSSDMCTTRATANT